MALSGATLLIFTALLLLLLGAGEARGGPGEGRALLSFTMGFSGDLLSVACMELTKLGVGSTPGGSGRGGTLLLGC